MGDVEPIDLNRILEIHRQHVPSPEEIESQKKAFLNRVVDKLKVELEKRAEKGAYLEVSMTYHEIANIFEDSDKCPWDNEIRAGFFREFIKHPARYLSEFIEGEYKITSFGAPPGRSDWDAKMVFTVIHSS